jgi:hypothetical protein
MNSFFILYTELINFKITVTSIKVTKKGENKLSTNRLYIVLTGTETMLTRAISVYTKKKLNHVSIAFDSQLKDVYSFGRKKEHNPFRGGFIKENFRSNFFNNSICEVYAIDVPEESYIKIYDKIQYMTSQKDTYSYNFLGLICVMLNIELKRDNYFFCSEFVATLLKEGNVGMDLDNPSFVQPHHFIEKINMNKIFCGNMRDYVLSTQDEQENILLERLILS